MSEINYSLFNPFTPSRKIHILTGCTFGNLRVISIFDQTPNRATRWLCLCACGQWRAACATPLLDGDIISCGCIPPTLQSKQKKQKSTSAEYRSFVAARIRCKYPSHDAYKYYGAKGVEFRFTSFKEFLNHIGPKPTPKHTLDRKNPYGHYEIGNVQWATWKEQSANKR